MKSLLSTVALLSSVTFAASQSCTLPTTCVSSTYSYAPEPCFPSTGVCNPLGFYAATEQGPFSSSNGAFAAQLSAQCQAICSAQILCASYAGTINATPDGKLATGTCFYYAVQQIYPQQCIIAPTGIVASYKQYVCLTSSKTSTTTKSTTTTTTTTTTKPITTTTTTKPITTTTSTTTTTTTPSTTTTTTTTTTPSTTTTTTTTTPSTTMTTTTTSTTTTPPSTTTTTTSTTSSTTTDTTTTTTTSTTTTTTTTDTTTTTAAPAPAFYPCTGPPYGNAGGAGAGGCPSVCYCDHDVSGQQFCEDATSCGTPCSSDADCAAGTMCTDSYTTECGGSVCLDSTSCMQWTNKRSLGTRGDQSWKYWENMKMEAKRANELHPTKAAA